MQLKTWISTEPAGEPAPPQRRFDMVALLLVVALGAGLRLYRIGAQPLWVDEASSLRFARQTLPQLWNWHSLVDPGNPPLYYSLLHGWLVFGDSETALRLLSALFGVLTIPLVYALGRTIRDHRLGIDERAPVRDLPVPDLVRTGGARVFPPRARGDGGDVGSRLAPSHPRAVGALAREWLGVARLRGRNDRGAPRARHGRLPADRRERADPGLVVDTRAWAARLPSQLVTGPARGPLSVGHVAARVRAQSPTASPTPGSNARPWAAC